MRKTKTTNNSIKSEKDTKSRCSNWEEAMADRLRLYADKPDSWFIEEFYLNEGITDSTFYDAVRRNETLTQAHKYALTRCGINREKIAIKGRENVNTTNSSMLYHYLDRWTKHKCHNEDREDKKIAGVKEALGNITIIDHMLEEKE